MSQHITRIGIDLAKNVFQVCGTNVRGKVIFNQAMKRRQLPLFMARHPACEVILEACASAHYWARVFGSQGYQVKLIHPAFVRPYVKTNKNDAADAAALCEAASRPNMRYVQAKTIAQQDIQLLHRICERLVAQATGLSNQIRGLLGEYGLVIPQGRMALRRQLPSILEDAENELSFTARVAFNALYQELVSLDQRVDQVKQSISELAKENDSCQRLMTIPGVGPMVATAVFCAMGSAQQFKNGREFAAFVGLVPRQYGSGGKTT